MSEVVDVEVRAIGAGGVGIAELPDGRVVFVPRTAPGDRARVRLTKDRRNWARAEVVELTEPSPDRVDPPCPLYADCGGCQLQHISYADQLTWKARIVTDALTRIGGWSDAPDVDVVPSMETTRYRNRITYTLRRLRGGRIVAGFHALERPAHVIDVADECLLPDPVLAEAWMSLRRSWGSGASRLPAGGRLRLTLRRAHPEHDAVVLVVEGGEAGWTAEALSEADPKLLQVWHRPTGEDGARLAADRAGQEGLAPGYSTAPGFEQVNPGAAALLVDHVIERVGNGPGRAVDAYCGTGVYGRELAMRGWSVTGIERDRAACDLAAHDAPNGFEVQCGRVEDVLAALLPTDLLLVNPPRSGLDAEVLDAVLAAPPEGIVYVSCDPATLARDLSRLGDAYRPSRIRAFDLFPQTAHVETVVELVSRSEG